MTVGGSPPGGPEKITGPVTNRKVNFEKYGKSGTYA